MITTNENKPSSKADNLKLVRDFHKATIVSLGTPDMKVYGKLFYIPKNDIPDVTERYISFFSSEIGKEDIYVEACNRDNVPEDKERKLYKYKFNPFYETEYLNTAPDPTSGHVRYLVPVAELTLVGINGEPIKTNLGTAPNIHKAVLDFPDPDTDLPLDQLTIRDLAALILKRPVSKKKFINELITKG